MVSKSKTLSNEIVVSFLNLPPYITDAEIRQKLSTWGMRVISPIKRKIWPGTDVVDGTRRQQDEDIACSDVISLEGEEETGAASGGEMTPSTIGSSADGVSGETGRTIGGTSGQIAEEGASEAPKTPSARANEGEGDRRTWRPRVAVKLHGTAGLLLLLLHLERSHGGDGERNIGGRRVDGLRCGESQQEENEQKGQKGAKRVEGMTHRAPMESCVFFFSLLLWSL